MSRLSLALSSSLALSTAARTLPASYERLQRDAKFGNFPDCGYGNVAADYARLNPSRVVNGRVALLPRAKIETLG